MPYRRGLALLLVLFAVLPCSAQQESWNDLNQRVLQLYQERRYADAIPVAQDALRVAEATFGADDPRVATSLTNLAALYREQRRYSEAEPLLQRALRIQEKALESNPLDVARSLDNLGGLYREQGRYAEAVSLLQRALSISEKVLGPEHLYVAHLLTNLGEFYEEQGKYAEAQPVLQRALRIGEKVLGPENPRLAMTLNNLATSYDREGKYAEAELLLRRSLSMMEKAVGPEDPRIALPVNNLAMVYVAQGKYAQAEPLLQRVLRLREKTLGPDDPDVAMSLNNLAEMYQEEGKYAEAEPLFQRALRIQEKTLGPEHPSVAVLLNNLANLYCYEGKDADAEPLYLRVLRIQEKALGPEHPSLALSLNNLATLYSRHGRDAEAGPLFQRAQGIFEKTLGPEHPKVYLVLMNLAGMRVSQKLPGQAQLLYARAFDILFHNFQYHFTYMSENERLAFLATVSLDFPEYFSFVQQFHDRNPELAASMYDLLLWEKGFIAGSETVLRRQVETSGDPEALKLLDQLGAKRTQIAALINAPPEDREAWKKQIEQLEAEANELEKALVARSSAFAQQKKLERATWQQVRDALKPGEAAVEFARFRFYDAEKWTAKTYYVALVITAETKDHPQYVLLGEGKQLGKPLMEFQQGVQARSMESAAAALPGAQAYELFWKPLEPLLAGKKRIYLSPDGMLNQVPLGLIPLPDGKLLMEEYDLRLVSNTKDLLRQAPAPAANTAVLVGNPAFDLGDAQYRAALGRLATSKPAEPVEVAMLAPTDRSRDQGAGTTLPPLPGTGAEIQAVDSLLAQHGWKATTYTGDRALEEAVKQVHSPRLLHIATHGFFLSDQQTKTEHRGLGGDQPSGLEDPMLRSGLFFAGADRALAGQPTPDDLDDGVLTAYEATSLNLQGTELVVLSACNTGKGEVQNGEGVFGLRRALQEAGAQAVMMSLWSVPDKETQELMALFYGKWLSGMDKHEALRQAQLEMRERVKQRYRRDLPYYWGAFVLVGR